MNINKKENKYYKILPNSIEAEKSLLGSIIISNEKIDEILEKIDKNDFYNPKNKIIFDEIYFLYKNKKPIDLIILSESLEKKNILEKIGGINYLSNILKNTINVNNINYYCEIVKEKSITRKIIKISNEIIELCYNQLDLKIEELLDTIETKIFNISEKINNNLGPKKINELLKITIENIKKNSKNINKNIIGIQTGYFELDEKTLGFQKSDLIILAARPSMGKTTLAINLCEYSLLNFNKPILIFSLEMSGEQIIIKILSSLTKINQIDIKTGKLNNIDWIKISNIIKNIINKKNILYIDDSPSLTLTEIKTKSRKIFKENNGINLIIIDYLQLIRVPYLSENRNLEITEISRSLKSLAKELNVPIIAISQLNRSLEQRLDKRPINSDLRESGSLEQDADLIIFIYRDDMYKYNNNNNNKKLAEIIISKHRNGPTGSIKLIFNSEYSRFDNLNK